MGTDSVAIRACACCVIVRSSILFVKVETNDAAMMGTPNSRTANCSAAPVLPDESGKFLWADFSLGIAPLLQNAGVGADLVVAWCDVGCSAGGAVGALKVAAIHLPALEFKMTPRDCGLIAREPFALFSSVGHLDPSRLGNSRESVANRKSAM
jgi:hypothetical protein